MIIDFFAKFSLSSIMNGVSDLEDVDGSWLESWEDKVIFDVIYCHDMWFFT